MTTFRDDYERQSIQNDGWQASTPKLSLHWGEPPTPEQIAQIHAFNAGWAGVDWTKKAAFDELANYVNEFNP